MAGSTDKAAKQDAVAPQAPVQARPQPVQSIASAAVAFESDPAPALVRIDDGDATCTTPCNLKLKAGAHRVSFSASNHQPVEKAVYVPQDKKISVSLPDRLESVRVISDPPALTVSIDGQVKGETPLTVPLAAGEHRLQIGGKGLHEDQTIQVGHGDDLQVITVKPVQNAPANSASSASKPGSTPADH
jgi:hypothetical protein